MKKLLILIAFIALGAGLGGCNTVEGMGRNIERAGESIQKM